jgi:hypothetical protein
MDHQASLTAIDAIAGNCLAVRLRLLNRVVSSLYDDALRTLGLTARGKTLLERALPAWEQAQQQAGELLGKEGVALLRKVTEKLSLPLCR